MAEQNEQAVEKKTTAVSVIPTSGHGLQLRSLDDMWRFAGYVIRSGFAPKGDTPEAVVVKFQMGAELGITPMQAMQNIAVINGRPSLWGDIVPGLAEASGQQEYGYAEKIGQRNTDGAYPDGYGFRYVTKRRGRKEYSYDFTVDDAKKARLWGKEGPWTFYPDRMLLNRARTFCLRDVYPDILKGLRTVEENRDLPMVDAEFEVTGEPPTIDLAVGEPKTEPPAGDAEPKKRKYTRHEKPDVDPDAPMEPTANGQGQETDAPNIEIVFT